MTSCKSLSPFEITELPESLLMVISALAVCIGPIYSLKVLPMWPLLYLWAWRQSSVSGCCDGSLWNRDLTEENKKKGRYSFCFCFKRKKGWIGVGWRRAKLPSLPSLVAFSSQEVGGSNRSVLHFTLLDVFEDLICKSMYSILGFAY